jgi:spore germination cell wall hydrolase CwlJ-like protein
VSVKEFRLRSQRRLAPIVLGALAIALSPSQIGFQDLGALLARRPAVAERWHNHVVASPFGTIHAAMFSMPIPIGTTMPHAPLYALVNFDPTDITASIGAEPLGDTNAPLRFPAVNRNAKRDSLISRSRQPLPPLPPALPIEPVPQVQADAPLKLGEAEDRFEPYSEYEFASVPDEGSSSNVELPYADIPPTNLSPATPGPKDGKAAGRIFFGADPIASEQEQIKPWAPGEAPVVMAARTSGDPDIKQSALVSPGKSGEPDAGESVANKGEVTGIDQRPHSPAERLALTGSARAKAEKCLANAVYFESRGEAVRGQIAVAQVVMNRVFSPFYPNNVCDVVYQNAHRHLACQFTFACDGIPDVVTEPDAWARAQHIARDMLDGKLWMPEVAKATHYHAYWVHPDWVNEMKKIYKLGVHTFYRPRAWGDGSDEPTWGDAKLTEQEAIKEEQEHPVSHSLEWLRSEEGQAYTRKNARK